MLESFSVVSQQVIILFIMMLLGVIANKMNWLDAKTVKNVTNIVLYFVTPCVILNSFQRDSDSAMLHGLGVTAITSFLIMGISAVLAHLLVRDKDDGKQRVFRYAIVFSNCGFMGIPLQQALLGDDGVFFGAVYIAMFNIFVWTYGIWEMSGRKEDISAKKLILNPGILSTVAGIIIFLTQIKLPTVISSPISYMAALNTPLPMLIIGYYLGNLKVKSFTTNLKQYYVVFIRLAVVPLLALLGMHFCGIDKLILLTCMIACSAPTAANTAMFATKFGRDAELSAQMVSVATLISLVTIPLLVSLAEIIS